jgi:hypothetical protein
MRQALYRPRGLPRPPTARQKNQRTHCLNKEHLVLSASVTHAAWRLRQGFRRRSAVRAR